MTREGGLRVKVLPFGEEKLRRDVESFLERVRSQEPSADLARSLYRALVAPVADLVGRSQRVLILPDGPLHRLPFGALIRDTGGRGQSLRGQFLVEWKPLHSAPSLTVYGTLRAAEAIRARPRRRLVAFGDPQLSSGKTERKPERPGVARFNWSPCRTPAARSSASARSTPDRASTWARRPPKSGPSPWGGRALLHFATHGHSTTAFRSTPRWC